MASCLVIGGFAFLLLSPQTVGSSAASKPPLFEFKPPYGNGSFNRNSTPTPSSLASHGCYSNLTAPVNMTFNQANGDFNFHGIVNGSRLAAAGSTVCSLGGTLSASAFYGFSTFVAPVSGLSVIRSYWDLNWTVKLQVIGGVGARQLSAEAGYQLGITEDLVDLTLHSTTAVQAGYQYTVSHLNVTRIGHGPGRTSIPLVTALTKGHRYELSIVLTVNVKAVIAKFTASYADFSMVVPNGLRLKMVTVR